MPKIAASTALLRLRILDFSRVRAGPTCVRQFADFGADVIKIESPPGVDPNEGMGGPRTGSDFQNLHRNKRSMTLNLRDPEGVAIFTSPEAPIPGGPLRAMAVSDSPREAASVAAVVRGRALHPA